MISQTYALVMPLERVISHLEGKADFQTSQLEKNLLVTIDEGIEISSLGAKNDGFCGSPCAYWLGCWPHG